MVRVWDEDLGRWIGESERRQEWYRRLKAQRNHKLSNEAPVAWVFSSWKLHAAAEHLWACKQPIEEDAGSPVSLVDLARPDVPLMLGGMALENLFKAQLVFKLAPCSAADIASIASGRHDLPELLHRSRMRSNPSDRELLARLSHLVRWKGRYPSSRRAEEAERDALLSQVVPEQLWTEYRRVYEKFHRLVVGAPVRTPRAEGRRPKGACR